MAASKECIYCNEQKEEHDFSLEHIWPDALGGTFLDDTWRTRDVCRRCNNIAGVFVDGAFIKSFSVSMERTSDALSYLSPENPRGVQPLHYMGTVQNVAAALGEVIDYWLCHGAIILHLRAFGEDIWDDYVGGDPRRASKKIRAGRVLVQFTSEEPYWVCVTLFSVKAHFSKAERFVANLALPENATSFRELDPNNEAHKDDLRILQDFDCLRRRGEKVELQACIALMPEGRFLPKVALGVGYSLFGEDFLVTVYSKELRKVFREVNGEKRRNLLIRGSGYWSGNRVFPSWPGGWVLTLLLLSDCLALMVTPPSGRTMTIQVTDDAELLARFCARYRESSIWVAVPSAQRAVGPIYFPDYLAHMQGQKVIPELQSLNEARFDPAELPSVRGAE